MKFKNLTITNFRAVELVKMEALGDLVLIAGQNGVGKSCIFDSIRLLKSSYGSYNQFVTAELKASIKTKINNSNSLSKEYFATVEKTIQEIISKKRFILSEKELLIREKFI